MAIDWKALEGLREIFLSESPSRPPSYWSSKELLRGYDETFAQRIAAKWRAVLHELEHRRWHPEAIQCAIDWGCGTGIASRTVLPFFPSLRELYLVDRSRDAEQFAREKVEREQPGVLIKRWEGEVPANALLLLSHVLSELSPEEEKTLVELIRKSKAILWVEPGTPALSRRLIAIRERLRKDFSVVAPCPHQERCGLLALANERHWCHHFAKADPEFFQSAFWREFGKTLKIDLRSLPTSYLVLERAEKEKVRAAGESALLLGRARVFKGYAEAVVCRPAGVFEEKILRKDSPECYRSLKEPGFHVALSCTAPCVPEGKQR